MAQDSVASPGEFRRYRRFLSWFLLTFVSVGSAYLLVSVGITIYRRRHAIPSGAPVGGMAVSSDIESCVEELVDVQQGLVRHLQNFHRLLGHYDAQEAEKWSNNRSFWLGQWQAAGDRCQFGEPRGASFRKEWEELTVIHFQLRDTEASYTKELLRFGQNQAPRLDVIRKRLESVADRIGAASPPSPPSPASGDPTR